MYSEKAPFLARVIIEGAWDENETVVNLNKKAKKLLEDVCVRWDDYQIDKQSVSFLITWGSFMQFKWPEFITRTEVGDSKNPNTEAVQCLMNEAEDQCKQIFDGNLREKLGRHTKYITIGIDSCQPSTEELEIELVAVLNLRKNTYNWTGKSYPTADQEHKLVRVAELDSHFVELDYIGKVMILGCHDLFALTRSLSENLTQV